MDDPNNLVVTVISARGLTLKGHNKLEAYVNLTLNGPGTWKSKVQTDLRKTTGDCEWNQRCEFVVYGLDSVITITAYHKTVLGTGECIGVLEFPLRAQYGKQAPMWFKLRKKGNKSNDTNAVQKYRGELLLKFEFSNKLSTSMTSLNTVHGSSALSALKKKMHLGKKFKDNTSLSISAIAPNVSATSNHVDRINFNTARLNTNYDGYSNKSNNYDSNYYTVNGSVNYDDRSGLIVPPLKAKSMQTMDGSSIDLPCDESVHSHASNACSTTTISVHQSRTPSPTSLSDVDEFLASSNGRPNSTTSSGFGSSKSALSVNDTFSKDNKKPTYDELEKMVYEMQAELAIHEAKERDLRDYIGVLLARIMEHNPELLESVTATSHRR